MAQITLRTATGAAAGELELDDTVFGIQPNVPVMHQVVTAQLAARRAGTQSTKTRSEVRGGGAKPYRQKGTGNARQGSTNAPHYVGGGIAFAPKPRSYAQRTPKKMIRLALRSALSDRASEGRVVVVEGWSFTSPRTKDAKSALAALAIEGRALVVVESLHTPAALSFRNLPEVQLIKATELNAYDVLCNDWIVFEQSLLPGESGDVSVEPDESSRAIHPQDPAEGAPDEPTDEPIPSVHPDEPAEGPRETTDDTQVGGREGALEHGVHTDDTRAADRDRALEHGEAGSEGAEPSVGGEPAGLAGGASAEDER